MATSQPVSVTVRFDGAGAPLDVTLVSQLMLPGGATAQLPAQVFQLDAADKAAVTALWNKAKAALTLP